MAIRSGTFQGESKVSTWIMGITRNLSFQAIRAIREVGETMDAKVAACGLSRSVCNALYSCVA